MNVRKVLNSLAVGVVFAAAFAMGATLAYAADTHWTSGTGGSHTDASHTSNPFPRLG